jgi:hypothetical protein
MREAFTWIRTNAIPPATVEAGNGFSDPDPPSGVIGAARIVSPGEAAHGVHVLPVEGPGCSISASASRWLRARV